MWIFLNKAMLSVVAHRTKPETLLVRARVKGDIERIFPGFEVSRTPDADYLYRAEITRLHFVLAIQGEIADIDYPNFKASIATGDKARYNAYSAVWEEMVHLQYQLEPRKMAGLDNLELPLPGGDA